MVYRNDRNPIARLFRTSPFKPLIQHIDQVDTGAQRLTEYVAATRRGDWEAAQTLHERIVESERAADDLKDEIRLNLPRTLFLPISRSDLLELIEAQDKVINRMKDISGIMLGRRMAFPEAVAEPIENYINSAIEAVHQTRRLLAEFDELLDSGFGRDSGDMLDDTLSELARLEKQSDRQQIAIRNQMLAIEDELPPLNAMFLYRVIDWIGNLADRAERVGARLQILLSR